MAGVRGIPAEAALIKQPSLPCRSCESDGSSQPFRRPEPDGIERELTARSLVGSPCTGSLPSTTPTETSLPMRALAERGSATF